ncbi:uncharacterized protein LOC113902704 [Bos indicus x Bos taurus]|uniref:uncharacterized protein LOC113902704 n=1 Tax=Bos indicus x Bos taurus TaxID=30522 RepID=UPI000F7D53DB|nr:uncharacterized protein LOC113902704 [Bos indicus x Bos taurus]
MQAAPSFYLLLVLDPPRGIGSHREGSGRTGRTLSSWAPLLGAEAAGRQEYRSRTGRGPAKGRRLGPGAEISGLARTPQNQQVQHTPLAEPEYARTLQLANWWSSDSAHLCARTASRPPLTPHPPRPQAPQCVPARPVPAAQCPGLRTVLGHTAPPGTHRPTPTPANPHEHISQTDSERTPSSPGHASPPRGDPRSRSPIGHTRRPRALRNRVTWTQREHSASVAPPTAGFLKSSRGGVLAQKELRVAWHPSVARAAPPPPSSAPGAALASVRQQQDVCGAAAASAASVSGARKAGLQLRPG